MKAPLLTVAATIALAAAMAASLAACGEDEEQLAPAPTTAGVTSAGSPTQGATVTSTASPAPTTPVPTGTVKYVDPTYGYSFEYPANWFVSASPFPSPPGAIGTTTILRSYIPVSGQDIGGVPSDQLKVDFEVEPNPGELAPSDWLHRRTSGDVQTLSQFELIVDGVPGVGGTSQSGDTKIARYVFAFRSNIYQVFAYGPDSPLFPEVADILATFQFPR